MSIDSRPPVIAVMGPTASGKTAFALECANALGGEIVSVDSALVYRGLDIGAAKPTAEERGGVPHHVQVGLQLVQRAQRVAHALALLERGAAGGERHDVGALRPGGAVERQARAGAVLEEERSHRQALQGGHLLDGAGEHLRHDVAGVEQRQHLVLRPVGEVQQVLLAAAPRAALAGRFADWVGDGDGSGGGRNSRHQSRSQSSTASEPSISLSFTSTISEALVGTFLPT